MAYFKERHITLTPLANANTGLRPGQLGALHSVLAHFSVYDDPSIISLPTGYGKTVILMALPFLLNVKRVLVIEPSDALRRQTVSHFRELSTLRKLQIVSADESNPKVLSVKGRPQSDSDWEEIRTSDVVVSTTQSISPVSANYPDDPDLFDLILFDEAHHAPAKTWSAFLDHFKKSRFVFLTATPFRRDKKVIPGRMAYWYPVSKASREEAFGKVSFLPASVDNEMDEDEIDRAVANAAAKQLRADREKGYDHRIFARAASVPNAKRLESFYLKTGLNVKNHYKSYHQKDTGSDGESPFEG